jgi:hypothetical protein
LRDERVVARNLDEPSLLEERDTVGAFRSGKPVRDRDHGAVLRLRGDRVLNCAFCAGIEG